MPAISRMNRWSALTGGVLCLLAGMMSNQVAAQALTRAQGDAILKELRSIRELLEKQPRQPSYAQPAVIPPSAPLQPPLEQGKVSIVDAPYLGKADAPVTMVAFVDYECPFCKRFDTQTFPEIKKQYIDTGKLRYVIRDLPLDFHKTAFKAAVASHCAADQGKYWEMRDKLTANAEKLGAELLPGYAREIGMDAEAFGKCLGSGQHDAFVNKSLDIARETGVNGTPSFIIARTLPGDVVDGVKVVGAQPFASFDSQIKQLLQ